jgi:aerobic C4-dicarboxylate transport protein
MCKKPFYTKLYWQVMIGVLLGTALGYLVPEVGVDFKVWGDLFIKMLKMVIAPIVFCTIVMGIAGMSDIKKMGKMGFQSLLYFEVMTTLALAVGWLFMDLFPIGQGLHIQMSNLDVSAITKFTSQESASITDIIVKIVPTSFASAFVENEMTQVLFVAILFGLALHKMGGQENPVFKLVEGSCDVFFKMISMIMTLAPIGAFASMAYTVGKFGIATLIPLMKFIGLFWIASLFFVVVCMGAVLVYYKISIFKVLAYFKEEILVAIGTCTSEPMLPRLIEKLKDLGVKKETAGFVLPAGFSFNLDGSCLYFTMAALFLAQATDTPFPLAAQISLFAMLLITSKGATAVYGSAFVVLGSTLGAVGHIPVESMAFILGIDRFMAMGRTVVNMLGNSVAAIAIAAHNKEITEMKTPL